MSPNLAGQGFSARLRATARRMGHEKAERLGTHSLRREAVRAIIKSRGSLAQLLGAGQWRPSAYRLSLDLGAEGAAAMARVIKEASNVEAGTGEPREQKIP